MIASFLEGLCITMRQTLIYKRVRGTFFVQKKFPDKLTNKNQYSRRGEASSARYAAAAAFAPSRS